MLATRDQRMTIDEWLPIATPRAELVNGVETLQRTWESPTAQSTSARHALMCRKLGSVLANALAQNGSSCEVLAEGAVVNVDNAHGRIPDVSIVCDFDPDSHFIEPCVVIEVLSESTASVDHGAKVREYLSLGHIAHYLVVDARENTVTHYQPGTVDFQRYSNPTDSIIMTPPGISIALADLFA